MLIDRSIFYQKLRPQLFSGRLTQSQVFGIEVVLDFWETGHVREDRRFLAYMLATIYHETAATFAPVRETLAESDEKAIAILDNSFRKGRLSWVSEPYWRKDAAGKSWLGRGLVQLTLEENYARMGDEIGIDLVTDPSKAMDMEIAVQILFVGMLKGLFTGLKLGDFFNASKADWVNARRIINGLDRADKVAAYGRLFYAALGH